MVTLENVTRRARVFSLGLNVAPLRAVHPRRVVNKHGDVSVTDARIVHDDSLTILAGQSVEVPETHLRSRTIQKAIRRGEVRVVAPAVAEARKKARETHAAAETAQREHVAKTKEAATAAAEAASATPAEDPRPRARR